MGPGNFLFNSKFDFTAKSFVTNTVVITKVPYICFLLNERRLVSLLFEDSVIICLFKICVAPSEKKLSQIINSVSFQSEYSFRCSQYLT